MNTPWSPYISFSDSSHIRRLVVGSFLPTQLLPETLVWRFSLTCLHNHIHFITSSNQFYLQNKLHIYLLLSPAKCQYTSLRCHHLVLKWLWLLPKRSAPTLAPLSFRLAIIVIFWKLKLNDVIPVFDYSAVDSSFDIESKLLTVASGPVWSSFWLHFQLLVFLSHHTLTCHFLRWLVSFLFQDIYINIFC